MRGLLAFVRAPGGGRRTALFVANFAAAKGIIFLLPIGIAALASPELYGATELAQSIGLLVMSFVLGAPLNGITWAHLIRREQAIDDQLAAVGLAGALAGLTTTLLLLISGAGPVACVVAASIGAAVAHNILSTIYRTRGRPTPTAWADGTAALIAGLVAGIAFFAGDSLWWAVSLYGVVTMMVIGACGAWLARARKPGLAARLALATRVGTPMMLGGALAVWIGVGGRITIGVLHPGDVAAFGVAFRIAGLTLGLQQLAVTGLFAWLYRARTRLADPLLAALLAACAAMSAGLALIAPPLLHRADFAALAGSGRALAAELLPIVALQIFFWIGFAMLQGRVNRAGLAARSLPPLGIVFATGLILIFGVGALGRPATSTLCWLIALHNGGYAAAMWLLLARARLPHRKLGLVLAAGGLGLALLAAALG